MSETALATPMDAGTMETVLVRGDLSKLTEGQRLSYYDSVCRSLGLNPLTRPFEYIVLNGRLTLYARRDAADQLRRRDHISVQIKSAIRTDGLYIVTARATDPDGRVDEGTGAVSLVYPETIRTKDGTRPHPKAGQPLAGDDLANAIMKAETKAKRRVTLSICGLGWLDETETETIPEAMVVEPEPGPATPQKTSHWIEDDTTRKRFWRWAHEDMALNDEQVHAALSVEHIAQFTGSKADAIALIKQWVDESIVEAQQAAEEVASE